MERILHNRCKSANNDVQGTIANFGRIQNATRSTTHATQWHQNLVEKLS